MAGANGALRAAAAAAFLALQTAVSAATAQTEVAGCSAADLEHVRLREEGAAQALECCLEEQTQESP